MVDRLEKEVRKLQALSDMLMHMEGEPVPKEHRIFSMT